MPQVHGIPAHPLHRWKTCVHVAGEGSRLNFGLEEEGLISAINLNECRNDLPCALNVQEQPGSVHFSLPLKFAPRENPLPVKQSIKLLQVNKSHF